ncbi:LacI family DNA-binding transcriptional regulator [Micromonospora cremea]|uniref:LacI family DNA-binding transcriptional regulator n=1 Tax=Micromonospora cremea TaxID=709881 RepID=UPI00094106DE|nr:substrate-binding domain-containing protein [Micromonospora cremea]
MSNLPASSPISRRRLMENTAADREAELLLLDGSRRHIIDGLIFSPVRICRDEVLARTVDSPLVLIGEGVHDVSHDHIAIDNVAASHAAIQHLVEIGRRRIAFIGAGDDGDRQSAHLRMRGYREALAAAGLPYRPRLVAPTHEFGRHDGRKAMRDLLALGELPDAVFGYNDLVAIGALRALTEAGYRVPEDVAVIGIDDVEEGRFSTPTLTTIAPDKEAIGRLAVRRLVARIEGTEVTAPLTVQTPLRLVRRESTNPRVAVADRPDR